MGDVVIRVGTPISDKTNIRTSVSDPPTPRDDRPHDDSVAAQSEKLNVVIDDEDGEPISYPDGGLRAWLLVFGLGCGVCATFGFVNAWGVFQAYYEETLLRDTPASNIAWIGSIQYALVFIPGLVFGKLFDLGWFKTPLLISSGYWEFVLCQGIAVGLACGAIFGPIMGIVPHWFKKNLNLAYCAMSIGSSVGGTIFPIIVRNLIQDVGFKWTMRITGFIMLFLLGFCNIFAERRLPPKKDLGPFFNLRAFKSPAYSLFSASAFVNFLGLYTILTYIDVSAQAAGIPKNFSFYLLPIANVGSGCGRIIAGLGADRIGPLNMVIPFTIVNGLVTFLWPLAHSVGGYVVLALVYGATAGIFASLVASPVVPMGSRYDVGTRVGMTFTILAMGALAGPPISGAILDATGSYKWVGIYAGTSIELAVVLMVIARWFVLKGWKGKC
ncbi:MFS general substrate transporter [Amylocystis lapponica]|nr:MFS general substrate transporter [Amylocystis lapponica]